jgi:RimJ/RimL family protein N-acetyltransferase
VSARLEAAWGELRVREPNDEELRAAAARLAAAYNDPHNRAMMGNAQAFTDEDVVAHWREMATAGARQLLLYEGGALAGDADFRNLRGDAAEFAILVAAREAQGRGLGTRLAIAAHALAFGALGLARVYVTVLPENGASLRMFAKVGYRTDDGARARSYVDDPRDVSLSIGREEFEERHGRLLEEIRIVR